MLLLLLLLRVHCKLPSRCCSCSCSCVALIRCCGSCCIALTRCVRRCGVPVILVGWVNGRCAKPLLGLLTLWCTLQSHARARSQDKTLCVSGFGGDARCRYKEVAVMVMRGRAVRKLVLVTWGEVHSCKCGSVVTCTVEDVKRQRACVHLCVMA